MSFAKYEYIQSEEFSYVKHSDNLHSSLYCHDLPACFCILQLMQWWRIESVLITLELEYWAARFLFIRLHPIMIFSFLKEKEFINKRSPWGAISLGLYRREKIIVREIIKVERKSVKNLRFNFSTVTYVYHHHRATENGNF